MCLSARKTRFSAVLRICPTRRVLLPEAPCFALTYDCGHDHADLCRALPFYERHTNRIRHFHMPDFIGRSAHLLIGEGELDIDSTLRLAANCRVVLDVKDVPGLLSSVERISERNLL